MKEHPTGSRHLFLTVLGAGMLVLTSTSAAKADVMADARITGREIHVFRDGPETVSVVLGEFSLDVGERRLSGRDAVVWVRPTDENEPGARELVVYVEGDARIVEPGGASTTDQTMLVTLPQRGRLTARGRLSSGRRLFDFPLYQRARAVRNHQNDRTMLAAAETARPPGVSPQEEGPSAPPTEQILPATAEAQTQPEELEPSAAPPAQPVSFRCDNFTSEVQDGRRFTVARGHVYLSQGNPDSELFLEIRSQSAVVISEKRPEKQGRVPWSEDVGGVPSELLGAEGEQESLTGVYLEGDAVIRRGERTMRAPVAYYDFSRDRALVLEPVFRTIQEQRNIPVYIRADRARVLSARELWFKNAKISTSDFYTPTYHVGASTAYLKDTTPYDEKGVALAPRSLQAKIRHGTFNVRGLPVLYTPQTQFDLQEGHSALRKLAIGSNGQLGFGVESEWHLFRLLGLLRPKGFTGRVELNWYERGPMAGVWLEYDRETYSGYALAYGMFDRDGEDDFGDKRENISAPSNRGRVLLRHKQTLPRDWLLQLELSYICDRNYLEQFYPDEFFAGKEQETLAYLRKQRDNWAVTGLLQYRMNRFLTQTESAPDLGFHLIGQPLLDDQLTFFHESRVGFKRYRPDDGDHLALGPDSDIFLRLDTRNEVDFPFKLGPVNMVTYAMGRATYWDDHPVGGEQCRPYGQVGLRANLHIWRLYDNVDSRLWDVHRLKHIITPEVNGFVSCAGGVEPWDLFPMEPDIEQHLRRQSGVAIGLHQRLQTKRGPAGNRRTVDWMRLNLVAGIYDNGPDLLPADGRFFFYRPEYSLGRNHLNADYTWHISDATTLLADGNLDLDTGILRRANAGFAVSRDPRLRYYLGLRYIRDLDSAIGVFGFRYKINPKYSIDLLEQYDFDYEGGECMVSSVTVTRKLPRWYASVTFAYDTTYDNVTLYLSMWPEGVPEARLSTGRLSIFQESDMN